MAKNAENTKPTTDPKAPGSKITGPKVARRARGSGDFVSVNIPSKAWAVLNAVARLQNKRLAALIVDHLSTIMDHEGISVEAVAQHLKGPSKPQTPKATSNPILERLFGANTSS